jgi:hypothetical protein
MDDTRLSRQGTLDSLVPAVYDELRAIARRQLSARGLGNTLSTTGLVHEAYLKLLEQQRVTSATERTSSRSHPS